MIISMTEVLVEVMIQVMRNCNEMIAMKLKMKSSSVFKDLMAGMKVDLCCCIGECQCHQCIPLKLAALPGVRPITNEWN